MPPPIPLSGAAVRYSAGSQSGSASSSANRGLSMSHACSGEEAAEIVVLTSETNARTVAVSITNSWSTTPNSAAIPMQLRSGRASIRSRSDPQTPRDERSAWRGFGEAAETLRLQALEQVTHVPVGEPRP